LEVIEMIARPWRVVPVRSLSPWCSRCSGIFSGPATLASRGGAKKKSEPALQLSHILLFFVRYSPRCFASDCWCSRWRRLTFHEVAIYRFYDNPWSLSELPSGARCCFCVASDFNVVLLHRMFHGGGFWKYHAIHHSSKARMDLRGAVHPVICSSGRHVDVIC